MDIELSPDILAKAASSMVTEEDTGMIRAWMASGSSAVQDNIAAELYTKEDSLEGSSNAKSDGKFRGSTWGNTWANTWGSGSFLAATKALAKPSSVPQDRAVSSGFSSFANRWQQVAETAKPLAAAAVASGGQMLQQASEAAMPTAVELAAKMAELRDTAAVATADVRTKAAAMTADAKVRATAITADARAKAAAKRVQVQAGALKLHTWPRAIAPQTSSWKQQVATRKAAQHLVDVSEDCQEAEADSLSGKHALAHVLGLESAQVDSLDAAAAAGVAALKKYMRNSN